MDEPPITDALIERLRHDAGVLSRLGSPHERRAALDLLAVLNGAHHPAEVLVSPWQIDMMRRATGGRHDGHRNYYCAAVDSERRQSWERLVEMGLAACGEPDGRASETVYHVTDLGYRFLYGQPMTPVCDGCSFPLDGDRAGRCELCGADVSGLCGECLENHECEDD